LGSIAYWIGGCREESRDKRCEISEPSTPSRILLSEAHGLRVTQEYKYPKRILQNNFVVLATFKHEYAVALE
jgi:hypothetical protein